MNSTTDTKKDLLEESGGVCLEEGNYSVWEFPDETKLKYNWTIVFYSEDSKYAKYQELRAKRLLFADL
jgi:hypothetical protein